MKAFKYILKRHFISIPVWIIFIVWAIATRAWPAFAVGTFFAVIIFILEILLRWGFEGSGEIIRSIIDKIRRG